MYFYNIVILKESSKAPTEGNKKQTSLNQVLLCWSEFRLYKEAIY